MVYVEVSFNIFFLTWLSRRTAGIVVMGKTDVGLGVFFLGSVSPIKLFQFPSTSTFNIRSCLLGLFLYPSFYRRVVIFNVFFACVGGKIPCCASRLRNTNRYLRFYPLDDHHYARDRARSIGLLAVLKSSKRC